MIYRLLADATLLVHFAFVLFVVSGALLVWRWWALRWVHLPVVLWGALIEFAGWICPLTPLENALRRLGGEAGYQGGFVEHYLLPLIYPHGLTRNLQWVLGTLVLAINVALYSRAIARRKRGRASARP